MRRAAKVDDNQAEIVDALRSAGASVTSLAAVGSGVPDLLIGHQGLTLLFECKDGRKSPSRRKLTPDQEEWIKAWRGGPVWLITSIPNAIDALQQSTGFRQAGPDEGDPSVTEQLPPHCGTG